MHSEKLKYDIVYLKVLIFYQFNTIYLNFKSPSHLMTTVSRNICNQYELLFYVVDIEFKINLFNIGRGIRIPH